MPSSEASASLVLVELLVESGADLGAVDARAIHPHGRCGGEQCLAVCPMAAGNRDEGWQRSGGGGGGGGGGRSGSGSGSGRSGGVLAVLAASLSERRRGRSHRRSRCGNCCRGSTNNVQHQPPQPQRHQVGGGDTSQRASEDNVGHDQAIGAVPSSVEPNQGAANASNGEVDDGANAGGGRDSWTHQTTVFYASTADLLRGHRAMPSRCNFSGVSALDIAAANGSVEVIRALVEAVQDDADAPAVDQW